MLQRHGTRLDIGTADDVAELDFAESRRRKGGTVTAAGKGTTGLGGSSGPSSCAPHAAASGWSGNADGRSSMHTPPPGPDFS